MSIQQPECPQCGFSHPPLADGKKCPMAQEQTATGDKLDFTNFFTQMKNILTANIQSKNIKDTEKLFASATVMLTKFLETYTE